MEKYSASAGQLAEQIKPLFLKLQQLALEAKRQDVVELVQADPDLSPLHRHILYELIHDQPSSVSLARDELTGLLLRTSFLECLDQALVQARLQNTYLAVCFIDLDGFKEINDQHGHVIGDQALACVASYLKSSTRARDLLCRWGGDEFIVVLQGMGQKDCVSSLANRILNAITDPIRLKMSEPLTLFLGASIGVSTVCPADFQHHIEPLGLIQAADEAMYSAKRAGKNCVEFAA